MVKASKLGATQSSPIVDQTFLQHQSELNSLSAWQQAILDSSEYGIISTDTEGVIATFNRKAEESLGYKAEEVIGIKTPEIIHDLDEVVAYARQLSAELGREIEPGFEVFVARGRLGMVDNREWTYVRKDGSTFPVNLSVTAIRGADQEIVGFLGTFVDLTERKASQANLLESKSRYQALFDSAIDGFVVISDSGKIAECNPAGAKIFGCTQQQIVGQTIHDFSPELQPDGQFSNKKARKIIAAALAGSSQSFEWRHTRADGVEFDAEVSLSAITMDGEPRLLGAIRDITDRKRAEEERSLLINELERSNTEMERFTYTISHELKTPLVTISGFAGLLQRDAERGNHQKLAKHVDRVNGAVETMAELLNELLEMSRIGRIANQYQTISLDQLARDVVRMLEIGTDDDSPVFEIEPGLPSVSGDLARLQLVLKNLLENAVKFNGDQTATVIKIGCRQDGDDKVYFVQDNGIGIDPEYQDRVFGLFERLNPKVQGTGVGLALVQRVVEDHGGRIWVESEGAGKGSTFCFTLPAPE